MKITPREYDEMNRRASPHSKLGKDCLWSFFAAPGLSCKGICAQRRLGHDQCNLDSHQCGAHLAGLVSEAGRKGRRGHAGAHYRLRKFGGEQRH